MHPTAFYLLLQAVPAALLFAALLSLGFQRGGVARQAGGSDPKRAQRAIGRAAHRRKSPMRVKQANLGAERRRHAENLFHRADHVGGG